MEQQLPAGVYLAIGVLTIGNLGVIVTMLTFIFKAGVFVAKTTDGIKDAKSSAVRAHKRIDDHINRHP